LVYCPVAHAHWHPDGKEVCSRQWLGLGFDVINSNCVWVFVIRKLGVKLYGT